MADQVPQDGSVPASNGAEDAPPAADGPDWGRLEADQARSDIELTLADTDHTGSETDQSSADDDQIASDHDQAASDRDYTHGGDPEVHRVTREIRARSTMRRWRCERRARIKLGALPPIAPDTAAASGEAYAVREALAALPRRQREVTALRYYLGLDVREIAAELDIAEGTVKAMLFRARQALAIALGDPAEEEVDGADR